MFDLHMHTVFSDGKDSPEEMILSALEKGLECVGFSEHSFVTFDDSSMPREQELRYREETERLRDKYAGRVKVLQGLERDYFTEEDGEYDYIIGSVHWVGLPEGKFVPVDWYPERLEEDVNKYFSGDWYALAEAYYRQEADVVQKTKCDIIGHFDLLTKFNEGGRYFDEAHPRYVKAWTDAADALLAAGKIFEINTGAISRGYRSEPYPAKPIREYLRERGGLMILSSDAHRKEHIAYGFENLKEEKGILKGEDDAWQIIQT